MQQKQCNGQTHMSRRVFHADDNHAVPLFDWPLLMESKAINGRLRNNYFCGGWRARATGSQQ
jgi:hypothetical protein